MCPLRRDVGTVLCGPMRGILRRESGQKWVDYLGWPIVVGAVRVVVMGQDMTPRVKGPKGTPEWKAEYYNKLKKLVESKGGILLTKEYMGALEKYSIKCEKGHIWESTPGNARTHWCPTCGRDKQGGRPKQPECLDKIRKIAESRGGELLSKEWLGYSQKYQFKCAEGHVWETRPDLIKKHWCSICGHKETSKKLSEMAQAADFRLKHFNKLKKIIEEKGGVLHDKEWLGTRHYYKVSCKYDHTWTAIGSNLVYGFWCAICGHTQAGLYHKLSLKHCQDYALSKGGVCLSTEYANSIVLMDWRCANGHTWTAAFNSMYNRGDWCGICAGNVRLSIAHCKDLAKSRGGECLSDVYINQAQLLDWKCSKGHTWTASYSNVGNSRRPTWCPKCAKQSSKAEEEIYEIVKSFIPTALHKKKRLLKTKNFEIDVWAPEARKGLEYDGKYWHSKDDAIERDARKDIQCRDAEIDLLRIKEVDWIKDRATELKKIFKHFGIET